MSSQHLNNPGMLYNYVLFSLKTFGLQSLSLSRYLTFN
jgi:hypothetical protein